MNTLNIVLTVLGRNFYERPSRRNPEVRKSIELFPDMLDWPDRTKIEGYIQDLSETNLEELEYQYSVLFEGQGHMTSPPWGSVYLDPNNIVFGSSTHDYRLFMEENGLPIDLGRKEPEDQFGLMLLGLSQLLEKNKDEAALILLTDHMLPWAYRYLDLLASNEVSVFYAQLAKVTNELFTLLQAEFELSVVELELHY